MLSDALGKAKNKGFADLLRQEAAPHKFQTVAALAEKAGVKPSAIFMVLSNKRPLSDTVALAIAKALLPEHDDPSTMAENLLRDANKNASHEATQRRRNLISRGKVGSVLDRVRMRGRIVAGVVVNEPFVHSGRGGGGFAVELFQHLANLMNLRFDYRTVEFANLKSELADGEIDLVVTALLPTFHRRLFMSFSRPLPYLRVPLSALVRRQFKPMPTVDHFLNRVTREQMELNQTRLLVIDREVGDEYARSFFDGELFDTLERNKTIHREPSLNPVRIAEKLLPKESKEAQDRPGDFDLFLADLATCRAVLTQPDVNKKYMPLPDPHGIMPPLGAENFPQLASYRIVFGMKTDEKEWQEIIDSAFECLLGEGIRALLSLYRAYLDKHPSDFGLCLVGRDETVPAITQAYFESAIPELLSRQHEEDELRKRYREARSHVKRQ